ncbi:hypothetical protein AB0O01_00335 [Streptomyces sp. NPDC093252]|uniref:hypothetical protein n=1 Tax=Streptomyces sp. NPDC093252 TaxID=3154980 RepID=UPI0034300A8E
MLALDVCLRRAVAVAVVAVAVFVAVGVSTACGTGLWLLPAAATAALVSFRRLRTGS